MNNMKSIYKRIILKLSGEALADQENHNIYDKAKLDAVAAVIKDIYETGVQIGIVVGAGNIWRGKLAASVGIDHSTGDYMGMLGTIMNGLAIQSALEEKGIPTRVASAINVPQVCEPYIRRKAIHNMEKGRVIIFAGGTGNPFFTTDSNAALKALDVDADAILMGKNGVEGVLDSDPRINKDAKLIKKLTYQEMVEKQLAVMDLTAVAQLENTRVKIHVFNMAEPQNIIKILAGEEVGSTISD
ncbi:MAG: UMP kinase [Bacilli bacterium]|nr:UMP kinase [Bacilli bacterium]